MLVRKVHFFLYHPVLVPFAGTKLSDSVTRCCEILLEIFPVLEVLEWCDNFNRDQALMIIMLLNSLGTVE